MNLSWRKKGKPSPAKAEKGREQNLIFVGQNMISIRPAEAGKEIGGKGGDALVLPCVLPLICTSSLSLTQTRILVTDLRRSTQIRPVSLRFIQIHCVSLRLTQSMSDPSKPTLIRAARRPARSHSDSCRFIQVHTDLLRSMQFYSDSLRFAKCSSVSSSNVCRSLQSRSNSFRFIQSNARFVLPPTGSFRFTKMNSNLLRLVQDGQSWKERGNVAGHRRKGEGAKPIISSLIRRE